MSMDHTPLSSYILIGLLHGSTHGPLNAMGMVHPECQRLSRNRASNKAGQGVAPSKDLAYKQPLLQAHALS